VSDTPPTPFEARKPAVQPPAGFDFNTAVAFRLDNVESDVRKVIKQQAKDNATLSEHATRLAEGEGHFTAIRAHLAEIRGALTWTIKLVFGAVLAALLSLVVVKPGRTPSAPGSAPSSSPWPSPSASLPRSTSPDTARAGVAPVGGP
jgi:hypothetical protein